MTLVAGPAAGVVAASASCAHVSATAGRSASVIARLMMQAQMRLFNLTSVMISPSFSPLLQICYEFIFKTGSIVTSKSVFIDDEFKSMQVSSFYFSLT